jgi:futalosine hydrolase
MNILITVATNTELQYITKKMENLQNHTVDFCTTGIGCTATAFELTKKLMDANYDLVINAGIAGSFNENICIGDVVAVKSETFGTLGVIYPDKFATLFDESLTGKNEYPFTDSKLLCANINKFNLKNLKQVKGLTVDAASGEKEQIKRLIKTFNADIETMEGAAFFYVCTKLNVAFLEFRAISNFIEPRNKNKWNIPLAMNNLANEIFDFINNLKA